MFRHTLLVFLLLASYGPAVQGVCETGWEAYGLFCYYFSAEALTFAEAEVACESNFASLAYIDDNGENVFLFGNGPSRTYESYWIGYKRVFGLIWRWAATGSAGQFVKWDIGEPDDEGDCARFTPYIQGVWRDWECERQLLYICKKYADCGPPPVMNLATYTVEPDMGTITNDTVYPRDSIATYTCDEGSEFADLSRSKTSLCGIGGVWSHDVVLDPCEITSCPSPVLFEEHMLSNATEDTRMFGTVLYYKCEPGYWFNQFELGVTKYLTCMDDKSWQGDEITECSKVYCIRPITSNAYADTPLNTFGTVATYTCVDGYRYPDNDTIKEFECTNSGWDPAPTPCEEMKCPEFSVPFASPSTDSLAVFTEVIWTCDAGMRYPDTTTRKKMKCQLDETWDQPITAGCERKKCEGTPPNASETYTHDWNNTNGEVFRFGDVVNYTCVPDHFFSDGSTLREVVCNEDGEWSPKLITDCISEIVEVVHGITHPPTESEGSQTMGAIALLMIGIVFGVILLLDLITIGKHITTMKNNICPEKPADEEPLTKGKVDTTPLKLDEV